MQVTCSKGRAQPNTYVDDVVSIKLQLTTGQFVELNEYNGVLQVSIQPKK